MQDAYEAVCISHMACSPLAEIADRRRLLLPLPNEPFGAKHSHCNGGWGFGTRPCVMNHCLCP